MSDRLPAPTPTEIRERKSTRFEVHNPAGEVLKFIVARSEPTEQYPGPHRFFVNQLVRGQNFRDGYVGQMDPEDGRLILTNGSRFDEGSLIFKVCSVALEAIFGRVELPKGFTVNETPAKKPKPKPEPKTEEKLPF